MHGDRGLDGRFIHRRPLGLKESKDLHLRLCSEPFGSVDQSICSKVSLSHSARATSTEVERHLKSGEMSAPNAPWRSSAMSHVHDYIAGRFQCVSERLLQPDDDMA